MPIAFRATVKKFRTDEDGEGFLEFRIPLTDSDQAMEVGKLIKRVLFISVLQEDEIGGDDDTPTRAADGTADSESR